KEADAALQVLRDEGSAVAFTEVLRQVRTDADTVKARLGRADVGPATQAIEADVAEALGEMIAALEKAIRAHREPTPPPPPGPGPRRPGKPPLVDLTQELKMVLSLQKRVHERTRLYGKLYPGEQAPSARAAAPAREREQAEMIQKELKDLARRQDNISKVT